MALSWLTTTTAPVNSFEYVGTYAGYAYAVENNGAVYSAVVNSDNTLGAWTATTAIPAPASGYVWTSVSCTIANGYLWLIDGSQVSSSGGSTTNYAGNCLSAPLSNGSVGLWSSTGQGSVGFPLGEALAAGNYMYHIGGHSFSAGADTADVYVATISGGSLSTAFALTTALPYTQSNYGGAGGFAWSDGSYVYLAFGWANGGATGLIYSSPIASGGTLGAWTSTTAQPTTPPDGIAWAICQGRVYMMGGQSSGSGLVYSSAYSGGVLSAWQSETSLPANLIDGSGFWTADVIYSASGNNNTTGAVGPTYYALLASPPAADTLIYPANGSYLDATNPIDFTSQYNSTDGANANARAMRLKYSSASSYNYWNVSTGAQQSTEVFNTVNIAPGASGTFTISGLSNANVLNWDTRSQESLSNLDGPYGSDFTVNLQLAPNLSINDPVGSVTTTNAPSLSYTPTPASGASVTGGRWLIYPLATTQASGFSINIGAGTIPAGAVSDVSWTGNPLTVAIQSGVTLTNGAGYVAYAAVTETGNEWSSTISSSFTISLDQPATPSITVVPSIDTANTPPLVTITVQGHDNILSADDASFEGGTGTWGSGGNATPSQTSAEALDGSYSMGITVTAGTQQKVFESPANDVVGGSEVTFAAFFMASASATAHDVVAVLETFDSSGTYIGVAATALATDTSTGWVAAVGVVTLPSNAATARLQVGLNNNDETYTAGISHYVDCCGIFPGDVRDMIVPASGYAFQNSGVVPTSIQVDIYTSSLCDFFFGADSSGAGYMARLDTRGGDPTGLSTTSSWTGWAAPTSGPTLSANSWHHFDIEIANGIATLTVDDSKMALTLPVPNLGTYFGFVGDGVGGGTFANLVINGVPIAAGNLSGFTLSSTNVPSASVRWTRGGLAGSMQATVVRADGFILRQSPLQMTAPAQQAVFTDYEAPAGFATSYTATESVNV